MADQKKKTIKLGKLTLIIKRVQCRIDEWYFRLHYRATTNLLFFFAALFTMDEFISKNNMLCDISPNSVLKPLADTTGLGIRQEFVESFCLMQTTYIAPIYYNISKGSSHHVQKVGLFGSLTMEEEWKNWTRVVTDENGKELPEMVHYAYYQWVPFFLFLQGMIFYVPHYIWAAVEGQTIKVILHGLQHTTLLNRDPIDEAKKIDLLGKYLWECMEAGIYRKWIVAYLLCEFLNIVVLLGNLQLTNVFTGYEFMNYGPDAVLTLLDENPQLRTDPMAFVFPHMTSCTFMFFGSSGSIQKGEAICFPTMNVTNEKVFIFLWFWFILLLFLTTIGLGLRLATLVSSRYRLYSFYLPLLAPAVPINDDLNTGVGILSLEAGNKNKVVIKRIRALDWILLRFIQLNTDEITFNLVLAKIAFYMDDHDHLRRNTKVVRSL